jgi:hypothetical protein
MHFVKRNVLANLNKQRNTRGRNLTKEAGGGHQATASPKSYASSAAPDYSQSELPRSTPHYQESFDRSQTTPSGTTSATSKPQQRSHTPETALLSSLLGLTSKLDKHAETKTTLWETCSYDTNGPKTIYGAR